MTCPGSCLHNVWRARVRAYTRYDVLGFVPTQGMTFSGSCLHKVWRARVRDYTRYDVLGFVPTQGMTFSGLCLHKVWRARVRAYTRYDVPGFVPTQCMTFSGSCLHNVWRARVRGCTRYDVPGFVPTQKVCRARVRRVRGLRFWKITQRHWVICLDSSVQWFYLTSVIVIIIVTRLTLDGVWIGNRIYWTFTTHNYEYK
jgi:hypothetical protein